MTEVHDRIKAFSVDATDVRPGLKPKRLDQGYQCTATAGCIDRKMKLLVAGYESQSVASFTRCAHLSVEFLHPFQLSFSDSRGGFCDCETLYFRAYTQQIMKAFGGKLRHAKGTIRKHFQGALSNQLSQCLSDGH